MEFEGDDTEYMLFSTMLLYRLHHFNNRFRAINEILN